MRGHWGIESAHWGLDVVFREDQARAYHNHTPTNFATLTRIAQTLLKKHTDKLSLRNRRKKAARNPAYLLAILQSNHPNSSNS